MIKNELIYYDAASIHAEMLRRHPEIDGLRSTVVAMSSTASRYFAVLHDHSGLEIGREIVTEKCCEDWPLEDYFGVPIAFCKWIYK